jgi:RHS repeat-associated protein
LKNADYTANVPEPPTPPLGSSTSYQELTGQNTYGYDAVGNRINETTATRTTTVTVANTTGGVSHQEQVASTPTLTTTATFNELNELTTLNEPTGISNFSYDNNGNLSQISKNDSIISKYEYDVRNQLTSAKDGANNELARFDYDFERKRIGKTSGNVTTNYTYAGSQVVNEYQDASLTATYGIGAGEIVKSEFANGENNFHYTDALGSVTAIANTSNGTLTRNEYNAFGEVSSNGGTANSIGYTGQRLDNETGLMALGNGERYYSPAYARFIQQDSWLGNSSMPQSLNRFSYGYNNPFKFTDPSGNKPDGLVAGQLHDFANSSAWDTGNETFDWWTRLGRNFVVGSAYDAANFATLGTAGAADVQAQDAMDGKQTSFSDAWMRNGYGASTTQIATNFLYYGAGVATGVKNVAVGIPTLAYGLATNPGETLSGMKQGLAEFTGTAVDSVMDPRGALDKLAQHSQEDIAFGVGEIVGETIAFEGAGALIGRGSSYAGRFLSRTRAGAATMKVFTEASNKLGAVRQGIRSFENKALSSLRTSVNNSVRDIGVANNIIKGHTTRAEMKSLRNMVREQAGTEIIFGSSQANAIRGRIRSTGEYVKEGNFFDPNTNTINLVSASRNQPRGMIMEEIQHALDNAVNPNLNNLSIMSNKKLHSGTFERMADNKLLPLTDVERIALKKKSLEWSNE